MRAWGLAGLLGVAALCGHAGQAPAQGANPAAARTLDDYRHFRALSIDLLGRTPTRQELTDFERPDFKQEAWIDKRLTGPGYPERLARIYMDALRLEVGPAFAYTPASVILRRQLVKGPEGEELYVYYRQGQRRRRDVTDGEFCLSQAETGLSFPLAGIAVGESKPVPQQILDERTVVVRPWWLYRDFEAPHATVRLPTEGKNADPLFVPVDELLRDPDKSPTIEVRVCREEAQTADVGALFSSGRTPAPAKAPKPGAPTADLPRGRFRPYPADDAYAKAHVGDPISCRSAGALTMSADCGCGPGLRHCLPGDSGTNNPRAFSLPTRLPLGLDLPLGSTPQTVSDWYKFWWTQEAARFLGYLFSADRDFREVLAAHYSFVNGPLAAFYRTGAPASCCDREKAFGMIESTEPLFDPKALPTDLAPFDTRTWKMVPDRGAHAAGLVTMPVFLAKYASRRSRAAALYTTFLCRNFVAGKEELTPSQEPNLTVRPGCASCHATLEPLAAYFSRVEEANWTFLPAWRFPLRNLTCKKNAQGRLPGFCNVFYDGDFSDATAGVLRGAYASLDHAAAGAAGAAVALGDAPEFAACAVQRVTSSFLGRPLTSDDDDLLTALGSEFRRNGLRMRPLVRAILLSDAYRRSNNISSAIWRRGDHE